MKNIFLLKYEHKQPQQQRTKTISVLRWIGHLRKTYMWKSNQITFMFARKSTPTEIPLVNIFIKKGISCMKNDLTFKVCQCQTLLNERNGILCRQCKCSFVSPLAVLVLHQGHCWECRFTAAGWANHCPNGTNGSRQQREIGCPHVAFYFENGPDSKCVGYRDTHPNPERWHRCSPSATYWRRMLYRWIFKNQHKW